MRSLEDVVAAAQRGALEAEIFGTTDAGVVAARLAALAQRATSCEVRGGLWYWASVATVAGVRLEDGREVVVRAYRPNVTERFLDAVVRVQEHLAHNGFPCASPVGRTVAVDGVLGRVESSLPDPGALRPTPAQMDVSAAGLARVVDLARGVRPDGLSDHPLALQEGSLYPAPHSAHFDFAVTQAGAEWIDEIATAARAAMDDGESLIAHCDWSARNVRLTDDGIACVYDWESVQHVPESTAVGIAAATWKALGELDDPLAPSAEEIVAYIDAYERARGTSSRALQRGARAAAVFALTYTARCEHALDPGTRTSRAAGRLAADAGELLALLR